MLWQKLQEAKEYLEKEGVSHPKVGIVLGSGLGDFAETLHNKKIIPYQKIPHFATSSVEGHKGNLVFGEIQGTSVICQQGRFHYYEGYSMEQVVFPVRVMAQLGVHQVIITNAAGAVNPTLQPGDLMIIQDHINFLGTNPLIGPHEKKLGPRFPDMSEAYSQELRLLAKAAAKEQGISLREGIYLATTGPSYETPAEIRMFRLLGADAVGMSTVPEVIALRHRDIPVLGISCITNMAAGILPQPLSHKEVMETGKKVQKSFQTLLQGILQKLAQTS